ncbi:16S rRNA (guanine(966)-N(2))-methyltransferase RsmD [Oxalobacteraceae bacterium CAVE-383]|nr:16S rRNA (guanine(966)-N(2))-methyltransferase RsmD [Oxalobacteraceae bacterium CAVE-383]
MAGNNKQKQQKQQKPAKVPQHAIRPPLAHQVRIIGGQWKRTPLPVPVAEGLRPTPDRVRETVFNWLGHLLDGNWAQLRCLDLFAGTGALGFEAASRGAAQVLMVECHTPAARQLEATKARLRAEQVQILRADALGAAEKLALGANRFDLVFLDPPYHQNWLQKVLPACVRLTAPGGLLYLEAEQALEAEALPEWLAGWRLLRADHAGSVFYHLLQKQ